ncbi:GIN domain-containing protein [Psychroflexus salinarum]|uniref:GIN domain-containing protein n=1 Tax=Psychroflexus salinarum TaxID=546024 RepID=A0ABW3GP68_9FLAO
MKKIVYILASALILAACDIDSTKDCLGGGGKTETRDLSISDLRRITIRENITLEITYSDEERLEAVGGADHLNQLEIIQDGNEYEFKASSLCTTGFSEAPIVLKLKSSKLTYVRNSSQFEVVSTNTLEYEELSLISEDFNDSDALNLGNFKIEVNNKRLSLVGNGISDFEISGKTQQFRFNTASGSGTILARHLVAQEITFFHRSFRDAIVTPVQSLKGEIRSSGNMISTKKPPLVEVKEFYIGKLIFE